LCCWTNEKEEKVFAFFFDSTKYKFKNRVLRAAVGDFRHNIPRSDLGTICKRATPRQWSYHISSKTASNLT